MSSVEFRTPPTGATESRSPFALVPTASPDTPREATDSAVSAAVQVAFNSLTASRSETSSPDQVVPGGATLVRSTTKSVEREVPNQGS